MLLTKTTRTLKYIKRWFISRKRWKIEINYDTVKTVESGGFHLLRQVSFQMAPQRVVLPGQMPAMQAVTWRELLGHRRFDPPKYRAVVLKTMLKLKKLMKKYRSFQVSKMLGLVTCRWDFKMWLNHLPTFFPAQREHSLAESIQSFVQIDFGQQVEYYHSRHGHI